MANQHSSWTEEYTDIVKEAINELVHNNKTFKIAELKERIELSPRTIRHHIAEISVNMGFVLKGVWSTNDNAVIKFKHTVADSPIPVIKDTSVEKVKKSTSSKKEKQKFTCKCLVGGEIVWMSISSTDKEAVKKDIFKPTKKGVGKGEKAEEVPSVVERLLAIYTSEEYKKVRASMRGSIVATHSMSGRSTQAYGRTRNPY